MRLYTDYSLRVLLYLGACAEGRTTIRGIAQSYGISRHHLVKVCHHLQKLGYLAATRGKGGGIRLGRRPEDIRIGPLVREMERDLAVVECLGAENTCVITRGCRLKHVFNEALQCYLGVLDRYTLAEMLDPTARLQQLLLAPAPGAARPARVRVAC
jgi:Rrf2 family nitric oxide-sensitive transcriptional repressor